MKRPKSPLQTSAFLLIAVPLMVLVDHFFMPIPKHEPGPPQVQIKIYEQSEIADYEMGQLMSGVNVPNLEALHEGIPQPEPIKNKVESLSKIINEPAKLAIEKDIIKKAPPPRVVLPPVIKGKGMVVIIIDDMGMDRKRSNAMLELEGPLTLAFLPYAPKLQSITEAAIKRGHELIIHVPMQPMDRNLDAGPLVLRDDMGEKSLRAALEYSFKSFNGYVGINNHMGSRLTKDKDAMDVVMEELAKRDLLFVDSKTIPTSVAAEAAAEHRLPYAERDIFLDNENDKAHVMEKLGNLEALAKKRGYAVAIGHPRQATLESLQEWLPTLKERELTLVPVSRVVKKPIIEENKEAFGPQVTFGPALLTAPQP